MQTPTKYITNINKHARQNTRNLHERPYMAKEGKNVDAQRRLHIVRINLLSSPAELCQLPDLKHSDLAPNIAKECSKLPCLVAGEQQTHACLLQSLDHTIIVMNCHKHHLQILRGILDVKRQIVNVLLGVLQTLHRGRAITQSLLAEQRCLLGRNTMDGPA